MSNTDILIVDKDEMETLQLMLYSLQAVLVGATEKYTNIYTTISEDMEKSVQGVSAYQSAVEGGKELCDFFGNLSLHTLKLSNFTRVAIEYIQRTTNCILDADAAMAMLMELSTKTEG